MKALRIYRILILVISLGMRAVSASEDDVDVSNERVFICHDFSDKPFAMEINEELKKREISTWFDADHMQIGDSVTDAINEGLRSCQYVAVIISEEFLKNRSLANREYKGTIQLLRSKSCKKILPIWRGVRSKDVVAFDPQLGDIRAERVSPPPTVDLEEITRVVDKIVEMINLE